jgi:hypothetical protein
MKYFLIISCLLLCYCSSKEEPDPLLHECPPEDIAEYPVSDPVPDSVLESNLNYAGSCFSGLKLSKEALQFSKQGGIRCVTANYSNFGITGATNSDDKIDVDCVIKESYGWRTYKKIICPWLTATIINNERIMHVSINQNETEEERKLNIYVATLYCNNSVSITQSPD